jgi:hypothetical protein
MVSGRFNRQSDTPMTPENQDLVRESFAKAAPIARRATCR